MTRTRFLILGLSLCCAALYSQPQVLPDVNLSSETLIRAPLNKKLLSFPTETAPDSFPAFIPSGEPRFLSPARKKAVARKTYARLQLGSDFHTDLWASLYPRLSRLPHFNLHARLENPGRQRASQCFELNGTGIATDHFKLYPTLAYRHLKTSVMDRKTFRLGISSAVDTLTFGKVEFTELRSSLGLSNLSQKAEGIATDKTFPELIHRHSILWAGHRFDNRLLWQSGVAGLSLSYRLPLDLKYLPDWRIGLITDFYHLLPAVDLSHRLYLAPNQYLELINKPGMAGWPLHRLSELASYSALAPKHRILMTPINLGIYYHRLADLPVINYIGLSHTFSYSYNLPQFMMRNYIQTPELGYTDLMQNLSSLRLMGKYWILDLEQTVNLDLSYLPDRSYLRRPYSPLFTLETTASTVYNKVRLVATLDQRYFSRDEWNRDLPEAFNLSFGAEYPLNQDFRLYTRLENIFNTSSREFSFLPARGRSLTAGLSYTHR